jgi:hypothetical protein
MELLIVGVALIAVPLAVEALRRSPRTSHAFPRRRWSTLLNGAFVLLGVVCVIGYALDA